MSRAPRAEFLASRVAGALTFEPLGTVSTEPIRPRCPVCESGGNRETYLRSGCPLLARRRARARPDGGSPPSPDDAGRFNISAEALLWWFKDNAAPPLVTDGLFGEPGTNVLLGGKDLDTNPNPGFRVTAGYALTKTWGVEGSFFYVPPRSTTRGVSSSGQPGSTDLWVTFIDPNIPDESLTELSATGFFAGSATETLRNSLMGAELIGTAKLPAPGLLRLEALAGFRYLRLKETYTFTTSSPNIAPFHPDVFETTDQFETTNNFYGLQLGARGRAGLGARVPDGSGQAWASAPWCSPSTSTGSW